MKEWVKNVALSVVLVVSIGALMVFVASRAEAEGTQERAEAGPGTGRIVVSGEEVYLGRRIYIRIIAVDGIEYLVVYGYDEVAVTPLVGGER